MPRRTLLDQQLENLHARWSPRPCAADRPTHHSGNCACPRRPGGFRRAARATCTIVGSLDVARRHDAVAMKDDARRRVEGAAQFARRSSARSRFDEHRFASARVRTGTRTVVALTSRVGQLEHLARFFARPCALRRVQPSSSNEPTCGTTLRASERGKIAGCRLRFAPRDRSLVGRAARRARRGRRRSPLDTSRRAPTRNPATSRIGASAVQSTIAVQFATGKIRCSARIASALTSGTIERHAALHPERRRCCR